MIEKLTADKGNIFHENKLNILILLNGNISIASNEKDLILYEAHFIIFNSSFNIKSFSPYIMGYAISLPLDFDEKVISLIASLSYHTPYKIINKDAKNKLLLSLFNVKPDDALFTSYIHILFHQLVDESRKEIQKISLYEQFTNLIDQNLEKNYCAGEYAKIMGVPIQSLIKETKDKADKTPCNIITERVITRAKYKLIHTPDSSKFIAYQLGFNDPYYFIKYFKKNVGLTPTQFRKIHLYKRS